MEPIYEYTLEEPLEEIHALALNNTLRSFNLSCEDIPEGYINELK